MKRYALLICCVVTVSPAFASFDLVMTYERQTGLVRRLDPTGPGTNLGSFGHGQLNADHFALYLDQSNNRVIVGSTVSNYAPAFNYNNGQYLDDLHFPLGTTFGSSNNGMIISQGTSSYAVVQRFDGTFVRSAGLLGRNFNTYGLNTTNEVFAVDYTDKRLYFAPNALNDFTASVALPNSSNYFYGGSMAVRSGRLAFASADFGQTAATLWLGTYTSTVSLRAINLPAGYNYANCVAFGHNNDVYVGARTTGLNAYVLRYNFVSGELRGAYATGGGDVSGIAVVLAPEPSSWMGVGLALLATRATRRKQSA